VTDARLACGNVTVKFGGLIAINDVDLEVAPGTIVGLVGPNGAGKTTLFGVLSGLLRPNRGRVWMDGEDVTTLRPQLRAARGLTRTFQHPELWGGLTVRDHLVLAYRARHAKQRVWADLFTIGSLRGPSAGEDQMVDELVELLGLGEVAARPALGLPLGVARLLELGRALAPSPTVLLLDEPSSGLDSSETEHFEQAVRRVSAERGISVLLVEHDVELVMRMCAKVYVLDFGVLIASGTPQEVRGNEVVRAAYLGEETPAIQAAEDAIVPIAPAVAEDASSPHISASSAPSDSAPVAAASSASAPILTVLDLRVRYGDATALAGISFTVGAGRALAVLGANGAGKSTLARAVSGLVPPCGGSVVFAGHDIRRWPAHRIRDAGLVHLPEGRGVFRNLTVHENLRMAAASLSGRQARRDAIDQALEIFPALADRRRRPASLLSGGEQQMLALSRALVTSPHLLVADEMSLGLAPKLVDRVFEGLERARTAGVAVIMIEQYVHRALAFADECLVLERGEVAWIGPAGAAGDEILRHYLGDAMTVSG
jgi:branched-chain amino acid transport system ATP-binding protein